MARSKQSASSSDKRTGRKPPEGKKATASKRVGSKEPAAPAKPKPAATKSAGKAAGKSAGTSAGKSAARTAGKTVGKGTGKKTAAAQKQSAGSTARSTTSARSKSAKSSTRKPASRSSRSKTSTTTRTRSAASGPFEATVVANYKTANQDMKKFVFPSVIESHNSELSNVAPDLEHGLKLYEQDNGYIIGQLALSEGVAPHKAINSSPDDLDYRLLLKSSLLLASTEIEEPLVITTGFPFSTFQINRQRAVDVIGKSQKVTFDTTTYGGRDQQTRTIQISKMDVLPEIVGCIIGLRNGERQQKGAFFMASIGYGTFEACLSTEGGIVQRTMVSVSGVRYAVELATRELMQTHYLGMRTEHQLDAAFHEGSLVAQRKRIDVTAIRRRALERYYEDVISPVLRNAWTDNDFGRASKLMVAGGGSEYPELIDRFRSEFGDILDIEVADDPMTLASRGFCLRSVSLAGGSTAAAVGIDVGNAQTAVTLMNGA